MKSCLWALPGLFCALSVYAQTPFRTITVLDKRPDTGAVYTRLHRGHPPTHYAYPVALLFKGSMEGQAFLLVRLFEFGVPNGSAGHKHLSISADAYVQTGEDQYSYLLTYQKTYPFGDLSLLPSLMHKAVGDFLVAAGQAYAGRSISGAALSLSEVDGRSPYAILNADTLVSGTYATFADFRDNRISPGPVVLTGQDASLPYRLDSPRSILPWALSDGHDLYIHWKAMDYTRLDRLPSGFSFRVPLSRGQLRFMNTAGVEAGASAPLDLSGIGSGGSGSAASTLVILGAVVGALIIVGVTAAIIKHNQKMKLQMLTEGYRLGYLDLGREEVFYDWQPYASQ
jgi:hypothetical protein